MNETAADRLTKAIDEAQGRYYRLVLLVGVARSGKTSALRATAHNLGLPFVNLNLVLTERLLELTRKQRALRVKRILLEELDRVEGQPILLDNIESLFDPELAQDPMRLLQGLSRNRTLAATWPGTYDGRYLTYAEPGHPEWRRYSQPEASIVPLEEGRPQPIPTQHPRTGAQEKR